MELLKDHKNHQATIKMRNRQHYHDLGLVFAKEWGDLVATLMLSAGVPAHVVQRQLGHAKIEMTLGIYAHALPSMQQEAATKLAALLHG